MGPLLPPRPCVRLVFLEAGAIIHEASGEAARATQDLAQMHRLRDEDKYKYYSQNLCINKYFWGILDDFIFWKNVSRTVKAYSKVYV